MAFPTVTYTSNAAAASGIVNQAAAAGLDISGLNPIAQLQSAVANLLTSDPSVLQIPAGDILSGTFGANKSGGADTGTYTFPGALAITGALTGVTTLATSSTINSQTISAAASFTGSVAFVTLLSSVTALATPTALAATGFNAFASTVSGATLMGFGTTGDVTLKNRAGTDVLVVTSNTTGITMAGALAMGGALSGVTTLAISGAFSGATTIAASTSVTVTSASAVALAVGLAGASNPAFVVDSSTATQAAGLKVTGAVAAGTVAVAVISSGATANLTLNALGTGGTLGIQTVATGQVSIGRGAVVQPVMSGSIGSLGTTQNSTPTIAQLLGGIVTQTSATGAGTVTLPTGTATSTGVTGAATGDTFDCHFFNLGGGFALTITAGASGSTVVGNAAVPSGKSVLLRFICTGGNAWSTYCIVGA